VRCAFVGCVIGGLHHSLVVEQRGFDDVERDRQSDPANCLVPVRAIDAETGPQKI